KTCGAPAFAFEMRSAIAQLSSNVAFGARILKSGSQHLSMRCGVRGKQAGAGSIAKCERLKWESRSQPTLGQHGFQMVPQIWQGDKFKSGLDREILLRRLLPDIGGGFGIDFC